MTLNSISRLSTSDAEDLMAHAARAAAEASRKASVAAANASLTITSPHSPEPVDVFNYDSDEKNDLKSDAGQDIEGSTESGDAPTLGDDASLPGNDASLPGVDATAGSETLTA